MRMSWQEHWRALVLRQKKGFFAAMQRGLLRVLSCPYRWLVKWRNWALDHGYLRAHRIPGVLVISVGNLVAGGTGKTPMIIHLAAEFKRYQTAILSRGYRSYAEKQLRPTIVCRGDGPLYSPKHCGDEPYLIAQRVPSCMVIVGKRRVDSAEMAARAGCQLLLLDDGMQHRRLARDFEVVVLDAEDPFGQGYHLPRGFLREEASGLSRASLVVLNHIHNPSHFQLVKQQIIPYTNAPLVGTELQVQGVQTLEGEDIPTLMGKKVGIFCGIGMPQKFCKTVYGMGGEIVGELYSADHSLIPPDEFNRFSRSCIEKGAELLVCTEKDQVKIQDLYKSPLPIAWVKVGINIIAGFEAWDAFVDSVRNRIPEQSEEMI